MAVKPNHIQRIRAIWEKTGGRCHFCGDPVKLSRRGYSRAGSDGSWEIDHVTQRAKGGQSGVENYLPACTRCNRLRWHRTGAQLRQLLVLGIIARREIENLTETGQALIRLEDRKKRQNRNRRKNSVKKGRATDPVILAQRRRDQRTILEQYLRQHLKRKFTANELSKRTGVGKRWIRPLLELSRKAKIEPRGRVYLFEGRPRKKGR
jgi:hypothetical protein